MGAVQERPRGGVVLGMADVPHATGTSVSDSAAPGVGSRAAQLASTADGGLSSRGPNPN
jgi:hypothetical protein